MHGKKKHEFSADQYRSKSAPRPEAAKPNAAASKFRMHSVLSIRPKYRASKLPLVSKEVLKKYIERQPNI